jgi:hypothetical protein
MIISSLLRQDIPFWYGFRAKRFGNGSVGFTLSMEPAFWTEILLWMDRWSSESREMFEEDAGGVLFLPQPNSRHVHFGFGNCIAVEPGENGLVDLQIYFFTTFEDADTEHDRLRRAIHTLERVFTWFNLFAGKSGVKVSEVGRSQQILFEISCAPGQGYAMDVGILPTCAAFLSQVPEEFFDGLTSLANAAWMSMFGYENGHCRVHMNNGKTVHFMADRGCACLGCNPRSVLQNGGYVLASNNLNFVGQCFTLFLLLAKINEEADRWLAGQRSAE